MSNPPTLDQLAHCEPFLVIRHDEEIAAQLRPYLFVRGLVPGVYWICNLVAVVLVVLVALGQRSFVLGLAHACLGMVVGYLVLMPVHEWLHAIAYRLQGFSGVSVVYRWRALTAMCIADRMVLDARQFCLVCLMPTLVINPLLIVGVMLAQGSLQAFLAGALLLHIAAASGDIALVNVLWRNRRRAVFTYDDAAGRFSRFVHWQHHETAAEGNGLGSDGRSGRDVAV